MKNLIKKLPIAVILCSTLLLLVVVGQGETRRTYIRFRLETSILQSDTVLDVITPFLDAGFPITMYSGYDNLASIVSESNEDVLSLQILDAQDKSVYVSGDYSPPGDLDENPSKIEVTGGEGVRIHESGNIFRLTRDILLEDGSRAGELVIFLDQERSSAFITSSYRSVYIALMIFSGLLTVFFYIATSRSKNSTVASRRKRNIFVKSLYLILFILLGGYVTFVTIDIYESGVRGKTEAIGNLLSERLIPVRELGIEFDDLSHINDILANFKERYAFVESVSINRMVGTDTQAPAAQEIRYDSNESMIGKIFSPDNLRLIINYIPLDGGEGAGNGAMENLMVVVSVPKTEVRNAVLDSIINFLALLVGASLIAMIFLNVGLAYAESLNRRGSSELPESIDPAVSLELIKAAYFLVVFVSSMAVPFLPLLVRELNNGLVSSVPFTIYYLFFAFSLIPAGNFAAGGRIKHVMALGFLAEVAGCIIVASSNSIPLLTAGRAMSGLGQGCFLIGFQSYVLSVTPKEKRTQGAAIKVIARNSALIGGTGIGALLYVFMGFRRLFMLSSLISITGFVYLLLLVPSVKAEASGKAAGKKLELKNIPKVFRDGSFLKVLFLTGIPAKMGITGVVNFAVPLLLASLRYSQEEIGRFLMLFFLISMLVTKIASQRADRSGNTRSVLFLSAVFGGLGMMLVGYQGLFLDSAYPILAVIGLLTIGIANGLISAPIVTQITKTKSAEQYGYGPMIAVYTFLERFGHIMGPMVLGSIIAFAGNSTSGGIGIFGVFTLVLGFLFLVSSGRRDEVVELKGIDERTVNSFRHLDRVGDQILSDMKRVDYYSVLSLDAPLYDISSVGNVEADVKDFVLQSGLMHEIIAEEKGQLLRYRGGNLQVSWNSRNSLDGPVKHAGAAALLFQSRLKDVNSLREGQDGGSGPRASSLRKGGGIGLHAEEVLILNQKQQLVKENIILGRTLPVSQYLSSLNPRYGTKIIVSSDVKKALGDEAVCRLLDIIRLPGGDKKMKIYELCAFRRDQLSESRLTFIKVYEKAFGLYRRKDWDGAQGYVDYLRKRLKGRERSVELLSRKLTVARNSPELTEKNWVGYLDV
jgi:predicted MFS family arabinose efflux permease